MLLQYVTVLQGLLAPALLIMALNVMLTVGEGRDKPLSAYWRLTGFLVGFAGAIVFAALRATAVITQRTFVNYPTLWCCVIFDIAVFVIVIFARRITTAWHDHRALLDAANLIAALAIAATTFRALPDVILRLTIFVEPGDPVFTSDMLLRALGFALGAATAIIAACIFRTMRSTAVRWSFTTAVLLLIVLLFASHFTDLAQLLQSKRIVNFPTAAFLALVWGINHQREMAIAMALVFVIPAVASIVMGFKVKPTGPNEAIARSHVAFRRRAKAAGAWSLVAMIGITVALTYGVAQTQKVITLSPPEEYSLKDGVASARFPTATCTASNTRRRMAPSCASSSSRRTAARTASASTPATTAATPATMRRTARSSARSAMWPSTSRPSASRAAAIRCRSTIRSSRAKSSSKPLCSTRCRATSSERKGVIDRCSFSA